MTEKHEVIVVIPYYHSDLSEKEIISLKQVQKVLKKYDLCFIAPLRLKPFFKGGKYQVEYFENDGIAYVYWTDENTYYSFSGYIKVDELLKMADSIINNIKYKEK